MRVYVYAEQVNRMQVAPFVQSCERRWSSEVVSLGEFDDACWPMDVNPVRVYQYRIHVMRLPR